jgi:hypothetical protein
MREREKNFIVISEIFRVEYKHMNVSGNLAATTTSVACE